MLSILGCSDPPARGDTLTVFAASSLAVAFEDIAARFEEEHPGVEVVLNLAGSQTLATQIVNGAEADVFASADTVQMERALASHSADMGPLEFATNRLVIVVEEGNPQQIETVADLGREELVVVLGADEVPVGRYTHRVLQAAGVEVAAASYEPDVGLVLAKVGLGEADAGIVYESDLRRADPGVEAVAIPVGTNVVARYPIAGWAHGGRWSPTGDFVEFVTSEHGRDTLIEAGFGA